MRLIGVNIISYFIVFLFSPFLNLLGSFDMTPVAPFYVAFGILTFRRRPRKKRKETKREEKHTDTTKLKVKHFKCLSNWHWAVLYLTPKKYSVRESALVRNSQSANRCSTSQDNCCLSRTSHFRQKHAYSQIRKSRLKSYLCSSENSGK